MSIEKLDLEKFKEYHRLLSKEYREGLSQKDYDWKDAEKEPGITGVQFWEDYKSIKVGQEIRI